MRTKTQDAQVLSPWSKPCDSDPPGTQGSSVTGTSVPVTLANKQQPVPLGKQQAQPDCPGRQQDLGSNEELRGIARRGTSEGRERQGVTAEKAGTSGQQKPERLWALSRRGALQADFSQDPPNPHSQSTGSVTLPRQPHGGTDPVATAWEGRGRKVLPFTGTRLQGTAVPSLHGHGHQLAPESAEQETVALTFKDTRSPEPTIWCEHGQPR